MSRPVLVLLLAVVPAVAQEAPATVRAVPFVDAVVPGEAFDVGVLFEMEPGWHVYWRDPGDAGDPPRIEDGEIVDINLEDYH